MLIAIFCYLLGFALHSFNGLVSGILVVLIGMPSVGAAIGGFYSRSALVIGGEITASVMYDIVALSGALVPLAILRVLMSVMTFLRHGTWGTKE